mgnify:CR=1 FL=1
MSLTSKSLLAQSPLGFHRIAYSEWGVVTDKTPVLCVHALTRNKRDFDRLAAELQKTTKIFCPDIIGRGESDWLKDPSLYSYPQYGNDCAYGRAKRGLGWHLDGRDYRDADRGAAQQSHPSFGAE